MDNFVKLLGMDPTSRRMPQPVAPPGALGAARPSCRKLDLEGDFWELS